MQVMGLCVHGVLLIVEVSKLESTSVRDFKLINEHRRINLI